MRAALGEALDEVMGDKSGTGQANLSLPLDAMIVSAVPLAPPGLHRRVSAAFRRHYDAGLWRTAQVYPGAEACLRDLGAAGVRAFVVTNKRSAAAGRLLEHFDLSVYFERVVGQTERGAPKAKSELAARCLTSAGLDPDTTVVVGDSDLDGLMAASRGMTFVAFTSGAGPLSQAPAGQDRVEMDSLADVAAFVLDGTLRRKS
jgi:phosphoglycolate phosphatase-like HAD superfamily hydrolase